MSDNKLTPEQLQALLQFASKKLGSSPDQLAKTVESGGVESLASRLAPADAAKFQALVRDKNKLEELLNSPQAQQLIQSLLKKK